MQVTVETTTTLGRNVKVDVPFEMIESEINKRVKEAMKTARIDGFRPGKVPEGVVRARFGRGLESDAINEVVRESLFKALTEKELTPAGQPELHFEAPYESGKAFSYTARIEIFPEVNLRPFNDLVIEKVVAEITGEDVEKTLEGMQKQQTLWEVTERPAREGDKVWIDFEGMIDNVPFEGGKAANIPLILGSKSMIPGFEEGLAGVTSQQALTLEVRFPENYHAKDLAGKPAQFHTRVHKVEQPVLPEINAAFAEKLGIQEGGIEKLQTQVKETLNTQLTHTLRNQLKTEVMSKLAKMYKDLEVPQVLVQKEAEHLKKQMQQQFAQLKAAKLPDLNLDMFLERAKERVILGFVVNKIVETHQLKAEPAKVRQLIENIAARYDQPEKIIHAYYQDKSHLAEVESLAIEEQVVDKILEESVIVEKPGKASEILNAAGAN
jgi:trigger factor